jgi:branched-chain amino acid transport system permease protein
VANEPWTYGASGTSLPEVFSANEVYVVALVVMAIAIGVTVFIHESHFGLSLRAIRSDPVSAAMAGINVVKARTLAWFISAALAGLAGAVWAIMTAAFYAETPFDLTISVYAIVFALFGGVRTVLGPVVGAVVLYSLYQYIGISNPQYFELVYGILIILLVLFLPGGLSSLVGRAGSRPRWLRVGARARASRAESGATTPPASVAAGHEAGRDDGGGGR